MCTCCAKSGAQPAPAHPSELFSLLIAGPMHTHMHQGAIMTHMEGVTGASKTDMPGKCQVQRVPDSPRVRVPLTLP